MIIDMVLKIQDVQVIHLEMKKLILYGIKLIVGVQLLVVDMLNIQELVFLRLQDVQMYVHGVDVLVKISI